MPAAARLGDRHACPVTPPDAAPHAGGPLAGPGVASVLIGGLPAAVAGDAAVCAGAAGNVVVGGSGTVSIGGRPAARVGDATSHGGTITTGCPTVLIGD